jgi:hypothetical protein
MWNVWHKRIFLPELAPYEMHVGSPPCLDLVPTPILSKLCDKILLLMSFTCKHKWHEVYGGLLKVCKLYVKIQYFIHTHTHTHITNSRWRSWLRHCATSQKVTGSIPEGVTGIFHQHNPSGRTMALGLTQPLTKMSTRNISWGGKGNWCVQLTTLPPSCANYLEIWEPQPPGTLRACPGL